MVSFMKGAVPLMERHANFDFLPCTESEMLKAKGNSSVQKRPAALYV
jgi:hypothetical protein